MRTYGELHWVGRPRSLGRAAGLGVLALCALVAAGCSGLLDVDNESDILDDDLNSPEAVDPVVNGVAGDFGVFYSQTALAVGLAAMELWHTGSHGHDRETDEGFLRRPSSDGNDGYNDGSRAYWVATDAQRRIAEIYGDDEPHAETAEVLSWSGYTLLVLADNWCKLTFDAGPAVEPDSARRMAEADFTEAIAVADAVGADDWSVRAIAGRARARLFLGDYEGAIEDAQSVPPGFAFYYNYSSNSDREYNAIVGHTRDQYRREVGVHPRFFEDDRRWNDPRTPMNDWGEGAVGPDAIRRWVEQDKYRERDADIALATWQELRLIEAEAWIRLNQPGRAVDLINQVRTFWGLAPYTGSLAADAVLQQLRYER